MLECLRRRPGMAALSAVALVAVAACSSSPAAAGPTAGPTSTASPPAGGVEAPGLSPTPLMTATPAPPAEPTPSAELPTAEASGGDGGQVTNAGGSWVGTLTEGDKTQGIRFELSQVVGVITGGAILESGDVQQVRATLEGNTLTLEYNGGVRVVYEGTIEGDTYNGTFTRYLNDQDAGSGTFETMRQT